MLNYLRKILIAIAILLGYLTAQADTIGPLVKIPNPPPVVIDDGEGGERMPSRRFYCSVNFDSSELELAGFDIDQIETFEIRDEDAVSCLYITDDCAEFVSELANIQGTVYVIFYFDGFTLSGYFSR